MPDMPQKQQSLFDIAATARQAIPRARFLRELDALIPWQEVEAALAGYCSNNGRRPHPATRVYRMVLLRELFQLSQREVVDLAHDSLAVRDFLGLREWEMPPPRSVVGRMEAYLAGGTGSAVEKIIITALAYVRRTYRTGSIQEPIFR